MSEEEKKELQELIDLLYTGNLSQYGKRKLVEYVEKQQKELNKEKKKNKTVRDRIEYYLIDNMSLENNPKKLKKEFIKLKELLEE